MADASTAPLGVSLVPGGAEVAVVSTTAEQIVFCLFDEAGERELLRVPLTRDGDLHRGFVSGVTAGARYGLRADGPYDPRRGQWFDPAKLLVDPYARAIDRPFQLLPPLSAPRSAAIDTAPLVPKGIVTEAPAPAERGPRRSPRFVYEIAVRAFSRLHPALPETLRGTVAGLAAPAVIDHLLALGVDTVELMPIAAWIDERHLPPLGLANAWGYNPVVFMAADPRLAPGGLADLRNAVAALRAAGIRVILDVVFNHTGESDAFGPTLSLRGLDNALYYRHAADDPGRLINDTGCGNTLATDRPAVARLIVDAMRWWIEATGVDGFRLDLASVLGRDAGGVFRPDAPLLAAIDADPILADATMIAEPWDVGPGGYQLGRFPARYGEWNDRFRDDVRRFFRGDRGSLGALATRIAGSADIFAGQKPGPSASVNFLAAHDGFALADIVAYQSKRNEANGEDNRDGTDANFSWNGGVEGATDDPGIAAARRRDVAALLATLFLSRGTPMLTAGDEFGRSQRGNNNAYAQDNDLTWLDWAGADAGLARLVGRLSRLRDAHPALSADAFLTGGPLGDSDLPDVAWLHPAGHLMRVEDWESDGRVLGVVFFRPQNGGDRVGFWINGGASPVEAWLPPPRPGHRWELVLDSGDHEATGGEGVVIPARTVRVYGEAAA